MLIRRPYIEISGCPCIFTAEIFKSSDVRKARDSFMAGEKLLLPLIGAQLQTSGITLDEALSMTSGFRFKVLLAVSLLKDTDKDLYCETVVRWKCLFSEFRVVAIRLGLKATFLSTSSLFRNLKASGSTKKSDIDDQIIALNKSHQSRVVAFLKDCAYQCWKTVALFPVLPMAEKVLTSDELIIEYILIGKHDENSLKASLELNILAIRPDGTRDICTVSERACAEAVTEWIRQWNIVTAENISEIHSDEERKLEATGQHLSSILFPTVIQNHIRHKDVKHIYLCPETHFGMIPLILLPGEDTLPLFEGRTVSYLGSCREIVRMEVMAQLNKEHQECHQGSRSNEPLDPSSPEKFSGKKIEVAGCYVFVDPNFDHKLELSTSGSDTNLWEQICALNPFQHVENLCHPLEYTLVEACSIEDILKVHHPNVDVHRFQGKEANLESVISLRSPLIVHFSTHGFGKLKFQFDLPIIDQDSGSGIVLAGFNTYITKQFASIDPKASTGILTPLTACGLDLTNTRLVFLSTCVSGVGAAQLQESTNSIANAFRVAGALTVIATSWNIADDATAEFVKHFYVALCKPETRPSEALDRARVELCKDPLLSSWRHWAGFSCYGDDIPVFSNK
jgi:hypothetical protein